MHLKHSLNFLDDVIIAESSLTHMSLAFQFLGHGQTVQIQIRRRRTWCLTIFGTQENSADPGQTPQNAASDQCLHCLLTGISIRNRIKMKKYTKYP